MAELVLLSVPAGQPNYEMQLDSSDDSSYAVSLLL